MTARNGTLWVATLLAVLVLRGAAQTKTEIDVDHAHRDTSIHWPKEFDPSTAPVFSHNELTLGTDCHRAFAQLADATHWPDWFLLTEDVAIEGPNEPIGNGTLLRLKIFNSPIRSRIVEFVPDSRISWIPFGADETESRHGHYHAWHFVPEGAGCRVITEETGIGPNDVKDPLTGSHVMHKAHELWLASLKYAAEP